MNRKITYHHELTLSNNDDFISKFSISQGLKGSISSLLDNNGSCSSRLLILVREDSKELGGS